jgi:HNH endonuclease
VSIKRKAWTPAQEEFVRQTFPHEPTKVLAIVLKRKVTDVYAKAYQLGLHKSEAYMQAYSELRDDLVRELGMASRFKKGHVPQNAGRKTGTRGRSGETQFKPKTRPHNFAEIGSLRVTSDGYLERKLHATGHRPVDWVPVHRIVWEAAHGPVPADHVVVFREGQRSTELEQITVEVLELVSRAELMRRNGHYQFPLELRQLIQLRGVLTRRINTRLKNEKQD